MEGLVLQNLTTGYGDRAVIKNLNLEVASNTTLILMGLSGSGKTTLLKTILGIIEPMGGSILLAGRNITFVATENRNIGYVPQNYGLFPHLAVGDNIAYGLRMRGMAWEEQRIIVRRMLEFVELVGYENKGVMELSGGQQ